MTSVVYEKVGKEVKFFAVVEESGDGVIGRN